MLAIMATSEEEGTAILDVISGKTKPLIGEVILNGQHVRAHSLRNRVEYVQDDVNLSKDMTVIQTLRFYYDLKKPTAKLEHLKIDATDRVKRELREVSA